MVFTSLYLLQCLLIGYATVLLTFRNRPVAWPFALGFGFSIGCCEMALLLFYLALAGVRPCWATLVAADLGAVVVLGMLHRAGHRTVPGWPADWNRGGFWANWAGYLLPGALVVYACIMALRIVMTTPLVEWDAWMIWLYKAKVLATEKLIPPPWIFASPSGFGHPHYPLLWPMLAAGAFGASGSDNDHFARMIPIFLWLGWGLMTYSALRWKLRRLPAAILASLQLALPMMNQYITDGDADVVLAVFYSGMIYLALRLHDDARWPDLICCALLATAAAFTKQEGMPLACFGAALVLAMAWRHGSGKAVLMAVVFLAIIGGLLAPWLVWSWHFPRTDEDYPSHVASILSGENLGRLPMILRALGRKMSSLFDCGPLWALLLIVPVMGWRAMRSVPVRWLWVLLGAHFLLYIFVYAITPLDLPWLISTTLNRLLIHITPVAILLIGYHWAAVESGRELPTPASIATQLPCQNTRSP